MQRSSLLFKCCILLAVRTWINDDGLRARPYDFLLICHLRVFSMLFLTHMLHAIHPDMSSGSLGRSRSKAVSDELTRAEVPVSRAPVCAHRRSLSPLRVLRRWPPPLLHLVQRWWARLVVLRGSRLWSYVVRCCGIVCPIRPVSWQP